MKQMILMHLLAFHFLTTLTTEMPLENMGPFLQSLTGLTAYTGMLGSVFNLGGPQQGMYVMSSGSEYLYQFHEQEFFSPQCLSGWSC